jgi:hypothetical protein
MDFPHTTLACMQATTAQADATKNPATFAPQAAIERQARMLCQRFALAPEVARTVAGLAFAAEPRS